MFKGPKGPVSGRTPRTQAEKIGTERSGFEVLDANYNAQGGHPTGKGMPTGTYKHTGEDTKPKESGGANFDPSPFTTKKE